MSFTAATRYGVKPGRLADAAEIAKEAHGLIMGGPGIKVNRVFVVENGPSTGSMVAVFEYDSAGDWATHRDALASAGALAELGA